MTIDIKLVSSRDTFFVGLSFAWESTIAVPGPGPFTITWNAIGPRGESRLWNIIKATPSLNLQFQTFGEGLSQTTFGIDRTMQVREMDDVQLSVEARGDTGAVTDTGQKTLPFSWLMTIGAGFGMTEGLLRQLRSGQTSATTDLADIKNAVYRTWEDG